MEIVIPSEAVVSDTRKAFLRAARRLFAERGFYGTSIAQVAEELGLTKQALLHHFGSKERLYGEVLAQMAAGLSRVVERARATDPDPERQLEELLLSLYRNMFDHPEDTQLLMRELLDNRSRAPHAHSWYLKDFLAAIVAMVRKAPAGRSLSERGALARAYLVLGAINYVVVSEPTLRQMYPDLGDPEQQFPEEIRRLVRTFLAGA